MLAYSARQILKTINSSFLIPSLETNIYIGLNLYIVMSTYGMSNKATLSNTDIFNKVEFFYLQPRKVFLLSVPLLIYLFLLLGMSLIPQISITNQYHYIVSI